MNRIVADYLAYDFLYRQTISFVVYYSDEWLTKIDGVKKAEQRWLQCVDYFYYYMRPGLEFTYLQSYEDQKYRKSMEIFARQTIEFAVKKLKATNRWEEKILQDVVKRLEAIKLVVGYPDEFLDPKAIDEIYSGIKIGIERNYAKMYREMYKNYYALLREPTSERRKLKELASAEYHSFKYSAEDNIMCNLIVSFGRDSYLFLNISRCLFRLSDVSVLPF